MFFSVSLGGRHGNARAMRSDYFPTSIISISGNCFEFWLRSIWARVIFFKNLVARSRCICIAISLFFCVLFKYFSVLFFKFFFEIFLRKSVNDTSCSDDSNEDSENILFHTLNLYLGKRPMAYICFYIYLIRWLVDYF